MILYYTNKFMSGKSRVTDENNKDVFEVKGWKISLTRYRKVYDTEGNLLFRVRNKFWRFFTYTAYIYDADKKKIATIRQKVFTLPAKYIVDGYVNLTVQSNGIMKGMSVYEGETLVGEFRRGNFMKMVDNFRINIIDEKYKEIMVALAVTMDNISDRKNKRMI